MSQGGLYARAEERARRRCARLSLKPAANHPAPSIKGHGIDGTKARKRHREDRGDKPSASESGWIQGMATKKTLQNNHLRSGITWNATEKALPCGIPAPIPKAPSPPPRHRGSRGKGNAGPSGSFAPRYSRRRKRWPSPRNPFGYEAGIPRGNATIHRSA